MKHSRISPDDPRLTAYALGELQGEERTAVEAMVHDDPDAAAAVEQIRAFGAELQKALANEPGQESVRALAGAEAPSESIGLNGRSTNAAKLPAYRDAKSRLLRFPQLYFVIGGLAAACFAVLVALHEERPPAKQYQEIWLGPSQPKQTTPTTSAALTSGQSGATASDSPTGSGNAVVPPTFAAQLEPEQGRGLLDQVKQRSARVEVGAPQPDIRYRQSPVAASTAKGQLQENAAAGAAGKWAARAQLAAANAQGHAATIAARDSVGGRVATASDRRENAPFYYSPDPKFIVPAVPRSFGNASPIDRALPPHARYAPQDSLDLLPGPQRQHFNTESYGYQHDNAFASPSQAPFSTFAVDVDTASYSNVRRFVEGGRLPPSDAVRIEELLNYFSYHYAEPPAGGPPFAASLEVASAPWAPTHRLVRIGLKAKAVAAADRPAANLVFLLDVSGSMGAPNKLPLVRQSMQMLLKQLRPEDRVAIVTYAGTSGLALPSTPVAQAREISAALDALSAGGSTNGASGIELAYDVAKAHFVNGGVNRVILCTDGDFNVGTTSQGELVRLIQEKAKTGVALSVLGFGMGNYKDSTLELLADSGNGNYGYIDTRREAEKLLVAQVNGTLLTVAKDVKVQVDFNPARVASYRLIGYEDRALRAEDFNNDAVDAGEIGAGHAVTALYEIVPVGAEDATPAAPVDRSRYAATTTVATGSSAHANELLTVKVRYQDPAGGDRRELEFPLTDSGEAIESASADFKLAAAVAEYGLILRQSPYRGRASIGDVIALAAAASAKPGDDLGGYRGDFIDLARRTQALLQ